MPIEICECNKTYLRNWYKVAAAASMKSNIRGVRLLSLGGSLVTRGIFTHIWDKGFVRGRETNTYKQLVSTYNYLSFGRNKSYLLKLLAINWSLKDLKAPITIVKVAWIRIPRLLKCELKVKPICGCIRRSIISRKLNILSQKSKTIRFNIYPWYILKQRLLLIYHFI